VNSVLIVIDFRNRHLKDNWTMIGIVLPEFIVLVGIARIWPRFMPEASHSLYQVDHGHAVPSVNFGSEPWIEHDVVIGFGVSNIGVCWTTFVI